MLCQDCCNCCLSYFWKTFIKIVTFCKAISITDDRYACRCFQNQWGHLFAFSCLLLTFPFPFILTACYAIFSGLISSVLKALQNYQSVYYFKIVVFFSFKFRMKRNGMKSVHSVRWKCCSWFNISICVFELQVPDLVPTKINGNLSMESNIFGLNFKSKVFSDQL